MAEETKLYNSPDYDRSKGEWTEIRDFYEGKKSVLIRPEYLIVHQLEKAPNGGALIRGIREDISSYTNFLKTVVTHYLSLMFKNSPDISEVREMFGDELIEDVDGDGTSLQSFIKDHIARPLVLYGRPLVRTDTYNIEAVSAGDEQAKGQRPVWKPIHPLDAPDWYRSQTRLTLFRHEYFQQSERSSLSQAPKEDLLSRVYELQGGAVRVTIYKSEKKEGTTLWKAVDQKDLRVPEIPIAGAWNSTSWVTDVTSEQRRHWNLSSDLDNAVHYQAYAIRVAKGITEQSQKMALSEYTILFLPRDAELTQLEPVYPQALFQRVQESQANLFRIAFNASRFMPSSSNEAEGEGALQERKDDMISFIQSQIEVVETVTNQAVKHWAMMSGKKGFNGKVKLSRKISTGDIMQMISLFQALGDEFKQFPEWKRKTLTQLANAQGFADDEGVQQEIKEATLEQPRQQVQERPKLADLINVRRKEESDKSTSREPGQER